MIRTKVTRKDGTEGVLIGLSRANCDSILAGDGSIIVDFDMLELAGGAKFLVVLAAEDEQALVERVRDELECDVTVHVIGRNGEVLGGNGNVH